MYTAEYEGINSFLVGASNLLLKEGVKRNTRGFSCKELPTPFIFRIKNPTARVVTIPERKWNPILPFAESLWLASGRNDLKLIGHYLKNMKNFSDDGFFLRGGYGPRFRHYNGISSDYKISNIYDSDNLNQATCEVDQFKYVDLSFKRDKNTRQAIINIGDPPKDCFDENHCLKETKDFPCSRLLHFQRQPQSDKLNLTVYMRSNDFMWGASAVNIFNFTFMLEYFAQILNLEIGDYYHIANNFHYYDQYEKDLRLISNIKDVNDNGFKYSKSFQSLSDFDKLINKLIIEEEKLRLGKANRLIDFEDNFFNDWYKTFYSFNKKIKVKFLSPELQKLFNKYYML